MKIKQGALIEKRREKERELKKNKVHNITKR